MAAPCLFFVKPRLPPAMANALRPQDLSFVTRLPFWLFQLGNIGNALGCFLPSLWMPAFANDINLPSHAGPLSLAFYNSGYGIGGILIGSIADRYHVSVAISITTVGGMIAAFVFWGLATSQAMLYAFAIIWGVVSGGFNATWPGCAAVMRRHEPNGNVDTGIVIGIMAAGKGVGEVASGPLSAKVLEAGWTAHANFAYGTAYGGLIVFCGLSAILGGLASFGRLLKMI
jgi:MFS family permease